MRHFAIIFFLILIASDLSAQSQLKVIENEQKSFDKTIPAGNYSGIAWLGGDHYAVVSDKSETDGFFIFEIKLNPVSGDIISARNLGFHSSGLANRDDEGIAYDSLHQKIYICGEADNQILEYGLDGLLTKRQLDIPPSYKHLPANKGLEALSFNQKTRLLWTCNESAPITITSFGQDLKALHQYNYQIDSPESNDKNAQFYAHGVGTLCALNDSSLLVLEREFYVPPSKIGAWVNCKLYWYSPQNAQSKKLLCTWKTDLSLLDWSIANYEGMCLGPRLADGSRALILVADSQNQYAGVLKDWIKSLRVIGLPE